MARCEEIFLRKGSNSYLQEVVDDVADLGLGEAVLGEVVNGGVDPAFYSLGPWPPHRVGRCGPHTDGGGSEHLECFKLRLRI